MPKDPTRKTLETIQALRDQGESVAHIQTLAKMLERASGVVVSSAVQLLAEWHQTELCPLFIQTFERLSQQGQERDPQCWGKTAIIRALHQLAWSEPLIFLQACRTTQHEPVLGGTEDSASGIRIAALQALVQLPTLPTSDLLNTIADLLADENDQVRIETAAACVYGPPELISPLLRLKIRVSDQNPRVLGTCFDALLALESNEHNLQLILEYAKVKEHHPDDILQAEALASLASAQDSSAISYAITAYQHQTDRQLRRIILTAMGASKNKEAISFLLSKLNASKQEATWAIQALQSKMQSEEIYQQVQAQLKKAGYLDLL